MTIFHWIGLNRRFANQETGLILNEKCFLITTEPQLEEETPSPACHGAGQL